MHLVIDQTGVIVASAASAAEIEWFDGYATAPEGVSILGSRDDFYEVDADLGEEGPLHGRSWAEGALVPLPAFEVPPEPEPVPDPPYELYKTDVISRLTDTELDLFEAQLQGSTTRERRMWADCTRLVSSDPYFDALKAGFVTAFGVPRATAILAKE